MTTKSPRGYLLAVSSISFHHHASSRLIVSSPIILHRIAKTRQYAKQSNRPPARQPQYQHGQTRRTSGPVTVVNPEEALPPPDAVKSAFEIVSANANHDPINPPRSTLPPPLNLPTRGSETVFVYYFSLGRAYGTFYKDGIKAVWYNYKASRLLRERLQKERGVKNVTEAIQNGVISRSEFQVLVRNDHDIGKLPLFGVLVVIFGEWLPLIVPFMPNVVPGTCRIPKQVRGMQEKTEERRWRSFTFGVSEPETDQWPHGTSEKSEAASPWPMAFDQQYLADVVGKLRSDQLYHLSCTLGLHKHLWDRLQLPPPSFLLRRALRKRLQYLAQDDILLTNSEKSPSGTWNLQKAVKPAMSLNPDELHAALSERGLDVLGQKDEVLRQRLVWWLQRQARDDGKGRAMLGMLFRRLVMKEWVTLNLEANDAD